VTPQQLGFDENNIMDLEGDEVAGEILSLCDPGFNLRGEGILEDLWEKTRILMKRLHEGRR
jgi:hypothetical protein